MCDYGNPPNLMDINLNAFDLWQAVETQWRVGFTRVGLDYTVVYQEADRLGIELTTCTFNKIKALERWILSKQHESKQSD